MSNRDFKGVWIPKEIWLNKELTMTEKILLIEIDSLDNEEHCTASNEYFAEFCNCGVATVTRAISKLKKLGYIEELAYDGRVRKLRVIKLISPTNQNDEQINIINNIGKDNSTNVELSSGAEQAIIVDDTIKKTTKKPNLFQKCIEAINEFTEDEEVRELLVDFLKMRLEVSDKKFGVNSFNGMLKKLRTLTDSKRECLAIIQQSIDRQYLTFYEVKAKPKYASKSFESFELDHIEVVDEKTKEQMRNGQKF